MQTGAPVRLLPFVVAKKAMEGKKSDCESLLEPWYLTSAHVLLVFIFEQTEVWGS